jgi:cytochrome P450
MHKTLGQTFAYHIMGQAFVCTIDPKNIEHFMKTNFENYIKGPIFRIPFTDLLGDGIFNVDGDLWLHQRKLSSKMFTKKQFETHIFDAVQNNTKRVTDFMRNSGGKPIDMFNLLNRYTLDTIGEIGFSRNIGSIEDPTSPFLKSFDRAQQGLLARFWTGQGVHIWKVFRALGLFWEPKLKQDLDILNSYSESIAKELIEKVSKGEDNSFVGLFIKDPQCQEMQKDPAAFHQYIRDMVLNFLIAGRDTTAQCLTWTLWRLAQAPQVVEEARKEVKKVCGDGPINYTDINNLRYIKAILDEGLRLHPSVPTDGKYTVAADVLPDGTRVPAGTIVQFGPYSQGRCTDIWGPDAEEFRPGRWAERADRGEPPPSMYQYSAFNCGPRECLGKRLAQMEMAIFLAVFVRNFDFRLAVEPAEVKYDAQLTLGCSSQMPMIVTPRQ